MTDIRVSQVNGGPFGITVVANDFVRDDGLETGIVLSLFLDRRCEVSELPPGVTDRRGWWGDVLLGGGDKYGSKLWLLSREKITPETMRRAKEYCEEALKWLTDDGVAESVTVEVERRGLDMIAIGIAVKRPNEAVAKRYTYLWNQMANTYGVAA